MYQNVFGSDGQIHLENQVGCQRFNLTTGEAKTVVPITKNMSTVFGKDGVETEIQMGQMRQLGLILAPPVLTVNIFLRFKLLGLDP